MMPLSPIIPPPDIPPGQGTAEHHFLSWDFVNHRMTVARHYWITTISPDGLPHVAPICGIWDENLLYFNGGNGSQWQTHLDRSPLAALYIERGDDVVILNGRAERLLPDDPVIQPIFDAYESKYGTRQISPLWYLVPERVLAWESIDTVTRWLFEP